MVGWLLIMLFQVKKAFFALVSNGVRAAPLWESKKQGFVGKFVCVCEAAVSSAYFLTNLHKVHVNSGYSCIFKLKASLRI